MVLRIRAAIRRDLIRMALDSTAASIAFNPAAFIVSPDSTNVSRFTIKTTVNPELANKINNNAISNPEGAYAASKVPLNSNDVGLDFAVA